MTLPWTSAVVAKTNAAWRTRIAFRADELELEARAKRRTARLRPWPLAKPLLEEAEQFEYAAQELRMLLTRDAQVPGPPKGGPWDVEVAVPPTPQEAPGPPPGHYRGFMP